MFRELRVGDDQVELCDITKSFKLLDRHMGRAGNREQHPAYRVSVGTMHRMKGLEFRCMVVAGIDDAHVPAAAALIPT
ncbi:hypothetical protein [Nocardia niigatensis]|uniref:hypothetical protein n=1 Tax=Nocardia niigatensis TaxID=209249 RepID=UPI00031C4F0F|nr:hypothetical protein [Nocardia niigatensis]